MSDCQSMVQGGGGSMTVVGRVTTVYHCRPLWVTKSECRTVEQTINNNATIMYNSVN